MAKLKRATPGSKPVGKPHQQAVTSPTTSNLPTAPQEATIPISALIDYRLIKKLSYGEIARLTGIPKSTVAYRLNNEGIEGYESFKQCKDTLYEVKQKQLYDALDIAEIQKMRPAERVTAIAIFEDKIRDIRGQNNSNVKPMVMIVKGNNVQINTPDRATTGENPPVMVGK